MSVELSTVHDCGCEAVWTLEATDRGALVRVLLACAVHAETLAGTYLRAYTVDAIPAPPGRPCGRSVRWTSGIPSGHSGVSPMTVFPHCYKRHGGIWTCGYEGDDQ
ncbi:hypothetical protein LP52_01115 [Streptomonospora alba]|uniref:Uncharacterized protein n=1 Tax=Streptomonospora alba TaxID=183763 RepID=A0A0C2GAM7_9ACTN|nr:hypothetical protein [Streptomonospora alba]KII00459.1 hypothetical protein LP52_01115 [Streptomonospora alba]